MDLATHDHEEADTLMILHCHFVAQQDPFTECVIFSPDTDVFLLLIYHFPTLCHNTIFRTGRGDQQRDISISQCYEAVGPRRANALLGFHAITGCDQTGRFNGKTKGFWWKHFINTEPDVIEALAELGKDRQIEYAYYLLSTNVIEID